MSRVNAGGCCDCQLGDMRSSSARAILPLFPRLAAIIVLSATGVLAQESLYPGEAYVTRFSGTVSQDGRAVIDTKGSVGSVIDIRQPGGAPRGGHWSNEPQRLSVTAGEIGQVFGIALDEDSPPNIYLTATSAFGLHRTPDNSDWMAGMWGPGGGPGTIWKLSAANNYRPEVFAQIALDHRANTGAALGNAAYDRWNRQFYVSDLETGMIHRLRLSDGVDLGRYDHGAQGRASFFDARVGASQSLPTVAFNPGSGARISDCAAGTFANHPSCWNFADFRRRVWGLGVRRDGGTGDVRLFYSVWGSQGFGEPAWFTAGDDQRNSVWSVRIGPDGSFDASDVRLEFLLPNFFSDPAQIASLGASHPVSDIAFPKLGEQNVMLLAERGGVRNLGLDASAPFARPHESRVLRYDVDERGVWRSAGRYDVGYYDRKNDGQPYLRANASGGVDFGLGYGADWRADQDKADEFVWITGDSLCSPDGPCADPAAGSPAGTTQVHGIQGTPVARVDDLAPDAALMPYPEAGYATPADTPGASYMIDADADAKDQRDDATKIGDVEVHEYEPRPEGVAEGWMPPGWTPPDWTAPPGYVPAPGWVPPPGWTPPPDWTPPSGWTSPPWWWGLQQFPLVTVGVDLELKKSAPGNACPPNAKCKFEITITNTGTQPYAGPLHVTDTLPKGWTFASATGPWACGQQGGILSCGHAPTTLGPGQSSKVELELQPPGAGQPAQVEVENCAEIDWKGTAGDGNPGNDKGCAKMTFGKGPAPAAAVDLQLKKSGPTHCVAGNPCHYAVNVTNLGSNDYTGQFSFTDTLPAAGWTLYFWESLDLPAKCTTTGTQVRCDSSQAATLKPGATVTGLLGLSSPDGQAVGKVENCAEIVQQPGSPDTNKANDKGCATVNIMAKTAILPDLPDLKIVKSAPAECHPGERCDFSVSIESAGMVDYEGSFVIKDTLPKGWTFEQFSFASLPGSAKLQCVAFLNEASCDTGLKALYPSANSWHGILSLRLPPNAQEGTTENCVELIHGQGAVDFKAINDRDCATVKVTKAPPPAAGVDLELTKIAPTECDEGRRCPFTIIVKNVGTDEYKGKVVFEDDSLGFIVGKFTDSVTKQWAYPSCLAAGQVKRCASSSVALKAGQSLYLVTEEVFYTETKGPSAKNCAWIVQQPGSLDKNTTNDRDCATVKIKEGLVDLAIEKTVLTGSNWCRPGQPCRVDVLIGNVGGKPFKGNLRFSDIPPSGWSQGLLTPKPDSSWTPFGIVSWGCSPQAGLYDCKFKSPVTIRPLQDPKGQKIQATYEIYLPKTVKKGLVENCVELSPGLDSNNSNNRSCFSYLIQVESPHKNLDIQMAGPKECYIGKTCVFGIKITNIGKSTYEGEIAVREEPPSWFPKPSREYATSTGHWFFDDGLGYHKFMPGTVGSGLETNLLLPGGSLFLDYFYPLKKGDKPLPPGTKATNCVILEKGSSSSTPPKACHTVEIVDLAPIAKAGVPGDPNLSFSAEGTAECTPPNCTFYEFTATNDGDGDYTRPLALQITMPEGARLLQARGTKASKSCPAESWSCEPSGNEILCRPSSCVLKPGEQTAVRLDVRLLPDQAPPLRESTTKSVCGRLEWQKRIGDEPQIEQLGSTVYSSTCITTTIMPVAVTPAPGPYDLALNKAGPAECSVGGTCSYSLTVRNTSQTPFSGPIKIVDELPSGWKLESAGSTKCTQDGDRVTCEHLKLTLQPNWTETITINARVPEREKRSEAENCASLEPAKGESDANRANDKSCVMTKIGRKRVPTEEECSAGERWDGKRCVPKEELQRCPRGQIRVDGRCVCPEGQRWDGKRCVTKKEVRPCPPGQSRVDGRCVCPEDQHWDGERCVPSCTGGRVWTGNACECPPGTVEKRGRCVVPAPEPCTGGKVRVGDRCVCPENTVERRGLCVPKQAEVPKPPQIIIPKLVLPPAAPQIRPQMIPTPLQIICPAGTVWSDHYKKCMPVVE